MLTIPIGWPIATRPAVVLGSGRKSSLFHVLDLAIVNSYILLSSCGGKKISHRDFRLTLIREMLAWAGYEPRPSMPVGRPASASKNIGRLDTHHNKHWPGRNHKKVWCRVQGGAWGEQWYTDVWSVMWCFVLTETVLKFTTQRPIYKTSFHLSSIQTVEASTTM